MTNRDYKTFLWLWLLLSIAFLCGRASSQTTNMIGYSVIQPQPTRQLTFTYKQADPFFTANPAHSLWRVEDYDATSNCLARNHSNQLCEVTLATGSGFSLTYTFKRNGTYLILFTGTDTTGNRNTQRTSALLVTIQDPIAIKELTP
jgi:hypothetical protein